MFGRYMFGLVTMMLLLAACGAAGPPPTNNAAAPSPSSLATIVGEITQTGERVLVEQHPGASIGNKIIFSLNEATRIIARAGDELQPRTVGDLAVGQRVEVWAAGGVAESFPGQATAETIMIVDAAAPSPRAAAPPDRAPDVVGTVTQASNTVWIDGNLVIVIQPTTQFFRRSGEGLEAIDAGDITEGQRVEVWTTQIRYGGTPQADAVAIVVVND